ncbi:hypothetical protein KXV22_008493 [Aspergillus fumigatus]|nr:hypothetical protein CNMCM8057_006248 [Aspergillus fumigatus]KAF4294183.1 hypothetical protein CNMCM8686_004131 [Aspergillus fumigatus]KAH1371187.1 hypothetical protein KXX14_007259 [Aspergillus fumigatus]KAH1379049.1 hypothetical protein KXX49_006939 [Aspergillus fumigatus]KAH1402462.1 hypothetical protein KXX51_002484 [Aspergillus fumigatus]
MAIRRALERTSFLTLFFILFMTVSSLKPEYSLGNMEDILARMEKQPSVFENFVSTVHRIRSPRNYKNPKVVDDPRYEGSTGKNTPKIYRPYPDYDSLKWQSKHRVPFVACLGPRNKLLNESLDDQVGVYVGTPQGFPLPMFGSYDAVGLDGQISFDRYTRYGAYGFGEDEESVPYWTKPSKVSWNQIRWGQLQKICVERNAKRFMKEASTDTGSEIPHPDLPAEERSAVLIRTYLGKEYSENDLHVIRSMVMELALQTGGEFEVVLLLHVKDESLDIKQEEVYRRILKENIPQEFWDMTVLWNTPLVAERYKDLNTSVIDVHHAQWLPVQWFMREHPEFEHFWNWEIDTRFTGHHYEYVDKIAAFARRQPRRGLWDRNARFYIPQIHGDYETEYRDYVNRSEPEGVWGPAAVAGPDLKIQVYGPTAPTLFPRDDNFEWGIGEEADFICFLPIFHPIGTRWVIRNEVYGYEQGRELPRRACLITHSRISRRLLTALDEENLAGRHMGSELFPVSTALYHGMKAVSAPHPIFSERPFPPQDVGFIFNSGVNGRTGSTKFSPFSWGREIPFRDTSWYYRANLPGRLYWNFLGWEKGGTGGKEYEHRHGRVCLPSILFHPVKDVRPDADSMNYKFDSELGFVPID